MTQKIVLFGADGPLGRPVLDAARGDGQSVTAVVPAQADSPADVETVVADLRDPAAVARSLRGHDVVCSLLGTDEGDAATLAEATGNIVREMVADGLQRYVGLGCEGILQATPHHRYMDLPQFPDGDRPLAAAHAAAQTCLERSGLDWTLVCPPRLTEGPMTNHYRTATDTLPDGGQSISPADVAGFLVAELASARHVGERVGIAY